MLMRPRCIPCLLTRVLYEAELVDPKLAPKALKVATSVISENYDGTQNSAELATMVHRRVYELLGTDPYREMKKRSNEVALSLLPKVEGIIKRSHDRLYSAALASIIGNILDFGVQKVFEKPEDMLKGFDKIYNEGLEVNDLPKARKYMKKGKNILYFTDNCGEIVFDKLFVKELKRLGAHVTLVVKGGAILTDATKEDALALTFSKVADEIMTTGSNAVGVSFKEMGRDLSRALEDADLIIAKGMANYESFSDSHYAPILYLMRIKCESIAEDIEMEREINVAKLYEHSEKR